MHCFSLAVSRLSWTPPCILCATAAPLSFSTIRHTWGHVNDETYYERSVHQLVREQYREKTNIIRVDLQARSLREACSHADEHHCHYLPRQHPTFEKRKQSYDAGLRSWLSVSGINPMALWTSVRLRINDSKELKTRRRVVIERRQFLAPSDISASVNFPSSRMPLAIGAVTSS